MQKTGKAFKSYQINCFSSNETMISLQDDMERSKQLCYTAQYGDEYYSADDNSASSDHYIYVTYPPEIKQKLLDR